MMFQFGIRGTVEHLQQIHNILVVAGICEEGHKTIKMSSGIGSLSYGGIPLCKKIYEYFLSDSSVYLERKYQQYLEVKEWYNRINNKKEAAENRNESIIIDKQSGMTYKELGEKYNMHHNSVSNLVGRIRRKDLTQ